MTRDQIQEIDAISYRIQKIEERYKYELSEAISERAQLVKNCDHRYPDGALARTSLEDRCDICGYF